MPSRRKVIRWTMPEAASEFGLDPATLAKRIKANSIEPGTDGKWSTVQICSAVFGHIDSEKLRETRHKANLLELQERQMRRQLLDAADVGRAWEAIVIAIRQAIWNCDAAEEQRRKWLLELRDLKIEDYFTKSNGDEDAEAAE